MNEAEFLKSVDDAVAALKSPARLAEFTWAPFDSPPGTKSFQGVAKGADSILVIHVPGEGAHAILTLAGASVVKLSPDLAHDIFIFACDQT